MRGQRARIKRGVEAYNGESKTKGASINPGKLSTTAEPDVLGFVLVQTKKIRGQPSIKSCSRIESCRPTRLSSSEI